jgi:hemophore-related protein
MEIAEYWGQCHFLRCNAPRNEAGGEIEAAWRWSWLRYLGIRGGDTCDPNSQQKDKKMMKINGINARRGIVAVCASSVLGGLAGAMVTAPTASAAPDCSASGIANTVSATTGSARQYLDAHPGANQAVTAALSQPRGQASANLRSYFTANPSEYYDLRGILAPIGDTQRSCNVNVLPGDLASAYNEFMAG